MSDSKYKLTANLIFGFLARTALVVPMVLLLFFPETESIINLALADAVVLGSHAILLLIVSTLIPAEYAIKTDIKILEYNLWLPQRIAIYLSAVLLFGAAVGLSMSAMYWYAGVVFLSALSHIIWPNYVRRVDNASKTDMIDKLQAA